MSEVLNLHDKSLELRYLTSIQANRVAGFKDGDEYFKADAILCCREMTRRKREGLVKLDQAGSKIGIVIEVRLKEFELLDAARVCKRWKE